MENRHTARNAVQCDRPNFVFELSSAVACRLSEVFGRRRPPHIKIAAIQGGEPPVHAGETAGHGMMKCGCGSVWGMFDTALLLDALILAVLFAMLARSHSKSEEHHARLDDLVTGVDLFANEVLDRTKILLEMGQRMQPAIELHNHNPLEQIFNFVRAMKSGNFSDENITSHRDSHGQYAPAPQNEIEPSTSEVIDISD